MGKLPVDERKERIEIVRKWLIHGAKHTPKSLIATIADVWGLRRSTAEDYFTVLRDTGFIEQDTDGSIKLTENIKKSMKIIDNIIKDGDGYADTSGSDKRENRQAGETVNGDDSSLAGESTGTSGD